MATGQSTVQKLDDQFQGLAQQRRSWWIHWQELAQYILPRRYKWLITPNQYNQGSPINGNILDSTGTLAARNCAGGMMGGICSPTSRWFTLRLMGVDEPDNEAQLWLFEVEKRMMHVLSESNFYDAMATMFFDLVVFGTAVVLIEEDYDDVIRCFNPCLGEFYLACDDKFRVTTLGREFVLTVAQCVQWFGLENCSPSVQRSYEQGGPLLSQEVTVRHYLEANDNNKIEGVPSKFKWRSIYWEKGNQQGEQTLEKKGYNEWPGMTPRWDVVANEPYGRSPGMDALGDIKQLQQETRRKAQAIDKMVNPPQVADVQLKNQPLSLLPGGVTFVAGLSNGNNAGMKPVYQVMPPIQEMKEDITEIQQRIKTTFFNDLFLMISQLTTVRSATEIDARKEEKMIMLGPVLERLQDEGFDPALNRVFATMLRAQLIPPPPQSIAGAPIQIQYENMLASAQKASQTAGMERTVAVVGNLQAVDPSAIDMLNTDDYIREYSMLLGNNPKIIASEAQVVAKRQARAQQLEQQQQLASGLALAKGAKVMSETKLGGGQSALDAMVGG